MSKKLKVFGENLLLTLNIFIIFLLIFEDKVIVPVALQSFGRMHPMLLHFPIVIILLAMFLEFFKSKPQNSVNEFYQRSLSHLLLSGTILAAITVIMGLFLSKEEGYAGDTLTWHKWLGYAIVASCSLIYWLRSFTGYGNLLTKISAITVCFLTMATGHFGAVLTHGENFITQPIVASQPIEKKSLEEAIVFNDIIQPILNSKCESCHGSNKIKGQLNLADSTSIMKGGKSGKLFIAGKPELSLLLQRVHLPEEDEEHMPPKGKPQLTDNEILILKLWIKDQAKFHKKVTDYPATDSLRILAAQSLKPSKENFDFAAADKKTLLKLNNSYRVISPVAFESPALSVMIFNKKEYSSKTLEELLPIKEQIISLNVSKMPVTDTDMKIISQFVNLKLINLNFTDVSITGLKELKALKAINSVSLAGTNIGMAEIKLLSQIKSLNKLMVWNTKASKQDIIKFKNQYPKIAIVDGFSDEGKETLQLNTPILVNKVSVFSDLLQLQLSHPIKDVVLKYTTDESIPDSIKSATFNNKTIIKNNTVVKVRAFKEGWIGSQTAIFTFYQSKYQPDSMAISTPLYEGNKGSGVSSLFDQVLGDPLNNASTKWIGTSNNNMVIELCFNKRVPISSVSFNTIINNYLGIYAPLRVELWRGNETNKFTLIKSFKFKNDYINGGMKFFNLSFDKEVLKQLRIVIKPVAVFPKDSGQKGKAEVYPVFLIDELMLN